MSPSFQNRLLRALPPDDLGLLTPHFEAVPLKKGDVVVSPNKPFSHAYFPESGLASVVSITSDGRRLEVGLFGREGMLSTALVLGADRTPHETFLQVEGTWLRIEADRLRAAMRQSPPLTDLLMRYVQTFLLVLSQTALSNGTYMVEERLARWLLMAHDRLDGDDLPLTHEFLSIMLGVQRTSVTLATQVLEGEGMIRAQRGRITVLDRVALERMAGDSYGVAEREYERLIGLLRSEISAARSAPS
ncbi:Crp/Fnr family transcriptional regulator [Methylobacterium sp. ID0610]|uniref:Crp/Fnr family transcriptional regulator n=1 Tax=Methylobacterium carpenticola TaxID=3344827 RepID=UPI003683EF34